MNSTKHFINLTNGIEALETLQVPINEISFIRIQSCYVERHLFNDILLEIDHNFLLFVAMGYECIVYDFGAKCDISKATYMGLAWIKFVLERRWFRNKPKAIIKNKDITEYFEKQYSKIPKRIFKRIDYYKKFLVSDTVKISAITYSTQNDNNIEYYRNTLLNKLIF